MSGQTFELQPDVSDFESAEDISMLLFLRLCPSEDQYEVKESEGK